MSGAGASPPRGVALPARLRRFFEGFWVVPLAISLCGLLAGVLIGPLGRGLGIEGAGSVDADGGRAALSAIAGGVMSVAGIVFSLTFVALSITAQQLSPRILDYVVRERVTQVLIGLALATFLFATTSLALAPDEAAWRLDFAVPGGIALAVATFATVILFAHRMTRVMRVEEMVVRLGDGFARAARDMLEAPPGTAAIRLPEGARTVLERDLSGAPAVRAGAAGYVAAIDLAGLVALAERHGLVIALDVRMNDHLLPGMALARVLGLHPDGEAGPGDVARLIEFADRRTPGRGADYDAASLSEAALRALSPGINDPSTAISCLNRLAEGIGILAAEGPPPEVLAGTDGVARLLLRPARAPDFLEAAVLPVAVAGQGDYRIRRTLARLLAELERMAAHEADRRAIAAFAARVAAREDDAFAG